MSDFPNVMATLTKVQNVHKSRGEGNIHSIGSKALYLLNGY